MSEKFNGAANLPGLRAVISVSIKLISKLAVDTSGFTRNTLAVKSRSLSRTTGGTSIVTKAAVGKMITMKDSYYY